MEVKVINISSNPLPKHETLYSAGLDIRADIERMEDVENDNYFINDDKELVLMPGGVVCIKTGLFLGIPEGYEIQVRPRSGLALKHKITVLNSPGTIDSDYKSEVGIILMNFGKTNFHIKHGDRIAQMVLNKYERVEWEETDTLEGPDRGGGFGHTGKS